MKTTGLPEEAVVDAMFTDPIAAAALLTAFVKFGAHRIGPSLLDDIARSEGLTPSRTRALQSALEACGLLSIEANDISLAVSPEEALQHAAVLRGVAYAQYRYKDPNSVEITLSPPAHPSRLMESLPRQGFAWARLHHTKDNLIELASEARKRFVIVSPFLDEEGAEWILSLLEAPARRKVPSTLILRGRDPKDIAILLTHRAAIEALGARILSYAITHDPGTRSPALETFHAKILLADNDKAYIGSSNMTRWSRDFSMECGVTIRGPCVKPVATLVDAICSVSIDWQP